MPMALRVGQVLQGMKGQYQLLQPLKGATVFKAKSLSSSTLERWWSSATIPLGYKR
jgi:hypothetical protein